MFDLFCDPMDREAAKLPSSSVHGAFPGKNVGVGGHFLLWGISQAGDQTCDSCISRWILYQEAGILEQLPKTTIQVLAFHFTSAIIKKLEHRGSLVSNASSSILLL